MSSYLVCATQRSGSTLLCALLEATGVAGHPREPYEALRHSGLPRQPREYFEGASVPEGLPEAGGESPPLWDREDYEPYFAWSLREGRTANGVFGAKLMFNYLADFLALMRTIPRFAGLGDADLLRAAFDDPVFVWVRRPNALPQAISLWKAVQTYAWREDDTHAQEPRYDYPALAHLVAALQAQDAGWGRFFAAAGIDPVTVVYRDLAKDRRRTMARVLAALGLPTDLVPADDPIERQADDRSREWAERFAADTEKKRDRTDRLWS